VVSVRLVSQVNGRWNSKKKSQGEKKKIDGRIEPTSCKLPSSGPAPRNSTRLHKSPSPPMEFVSKILNHIGPTPEKGHFEEQLPAPVQQPVTRYQTYRISVCSGHDISTLSEKQLGLLQPFKFLRNHEGTSLVSLFAIIPVLERRKY